MVKRFSNFFEDGFFLKMRRFRVCTAGLIIAALSSALFDARMKDVCSPKLLHRIEELGVVTWKSFADMIEGRCVIQSGDSMHLFEDDLRFLSLPDTVTGAANNVTGHTFSAVLC
jgi:hypothetical protein